MTEEAIKRYERELYTGNEAPEPVQPAEVVNFPKVPQELRILLFTGNDEEAEEAEQKIEAIEQNQQNIIKAILRKIATGNACAAFTGDYTNGRYILLTEDTYKPGYRLTHFYKHLPTYHQSEQTPEKIADCFNSAGEIYIV